MASHLNRCHRASKVAQKECNELYLLMYLQKHAKAEHAVVRFVPKFVSQGMDHMAETVFQEMICRS